MPRALGSQLRLLSLRMVSCPWVLLPSCFLPVSHVCTLVPTETTPGGVPPTRPWPDGCLLPTKMVSVSPEAGTPTSCTTGSPCPRWVPHRAAWAVLGLGPTVLQEAELCWALGRCFRLWAGACVFLGPSHPCEVQNHSSLCVLGTEARKVNITSEWADADLNQGPAKSLSSL